MIGVQVTTTNSQTIKKKFYPVDEIREAGTRLKGVKAAVTSIINQELSEAEGDPLLFRLTGRVNMVIPIWKEKGS